MSSYTYKVYARYIYKMEAISTDVAAKGDRLYEKFINAYYHLDQKILGSSKLSTHMKYVVAEYPLSDVCEKLVQFWFRRTLHLFGYGKEWNFESQDVRMADVSKEYDAHLDDIVKWYDSCVEIYGLPAEHTAYYDVRPAVARLRKSLAYIEKNIDNAKHYKAKFRAEVNAERAEKLAHMTQQRNLRWGLLRAAPMLMLWRKRATERVYHPDNVRKWMLLQISEDALGCA